MLADTGITLFPLVKETNYSCGNLDARSCITTMCLDDGVGLKKSTGIFFQYFSGNLCSYSDSLVFLLVNVLHALHFSTKVLTF